MDQPTTQTEETKPTFGAWLKSLLYKVGNLFIRYPMATAATVLLVVGAGFMMAFGQKVQIGGLLGWLWNRNSHDPNAIVTTPPPDRKDSSGQIIQPGQSDSSGWVQTPVVVPIKPPSILSDPTTIKVTPPGKPDVIIKLPTGVKNKDVKQVVMVAPNVYQVHNHDKGVDAEKILKDL
jgi:hypothetical protein